MTDKKVRELVILEGPDCAGKTTLLREFKDEFLKVHHGPFPGISAEQLPRFYVESMFPLFAGQAMVMDRCWLSEPIYGTVYRGGANRIGVTARRQLERMALRHGAVVVLCLPPWEAVKEKWLERKSADAGAELLDKVDQLQVAWELYTDLPNQTDLPVVHYDYTKHGHQLAHLKQRLKWASTGTHPQWWTQSAGSASAKVILVGERPSAPTSRDTAVQFPFCSFGSGSSGWLTEHLHAHEIPEQALHWVNADQSLLYLKDLWTVPIIALGQVAAAKILADVGRPPDHVVEHPQYHRRFKGKGQEPYPLADLIRPYL